MVDLISSLVVFALIVAFVTPWIRSLAGRNRPPATGRPVPRGPRDLAESGGYQRLPPVRQEPSARFSVAARAVEEEVPLSVRRPAAVPAAPVSQGSMDGRLVRRALSSPGSLRTAILLKEIMDPPVSMKDHRE